LPRFLTRVGKGRNAIADIVNLKRARKTKERAARKQRADERRAKSLTPKPLRDLTKAREEKTLRTVDAHKLDDKI